MLRFAFAVHLLLVAVLAAVSVEGQAPSPADRSVWVEDARQRLASDDPREVAWGAWFAGRLELEELKPELAATLLADRSEGRKPDPKWEHVRGLVVDALVRLGEPVPSAVVERAWRVDRAAAYVLASRDAADHTDFLLQRIEARPDDTEWTVAHELLMDAAPRALTASLLERVEIGIEIVVRNTDQRSASFRCGGMDHRRRIFGSRSVPTDYPLGTAYLLTFHGEPGGTLLTMGENPVFYEHRPFPPGKVFQWGVARVSTARDWETLDYLRRIARMETGGEDPLRPWSTVCVRYVDDASYIAAVRKVYADHRRRVEWLLQRLRELELVEDDLTPDDLLDLELRFRDERPRPRSRLPFVRR